MSQQSPDFHEPWNPDADYQQTRPLPTDGDPTAALPVPASYGHPAQPQMQYQPQAPQQPPMQPGAMPGYPMAVHSYSPMGVPAPHGYEPSTGIPYSDKSKVVAGLLQIFLGGLGVGRFYKGDVGIAILQILVTICTLGFGWLWPLIDGIVMLTGRPTDKQGRPLRP